MNHQGQHRTYAGEDQRGGVAITLDQIAGNGWPKGGAQGDAHRAQRDQLAGGVELGHQTKGVGQHEVDRQQKQQRADGEGGHRGELPDDRQADQHHRDDSRNGQHATELETERGGNETANGVDQEADREYRADLVGGQPGLLADQLQERPHGHDPGHEHQAGRQAHPHDELVLAGVCMNARGNQVFTLHSATRHTEQRQAHQQG